MRSRVHPLCCVVLHTLLASGRTSVLLHAADTILWDAPCKLTRGKHVPLLPATCIPIQ